MIEAIRRRPWLLVLAALLLFVAADLVLLAVALAHPPVPLP